MAKNLKSFQFGRRYRPPTKYPYDDWLNGDIWELYRGKDFQPTTRAMRALLWTTARKRGLKLRASELQEPVEKLVIQAY